MKIISGNSTNKVAGSKFFWQVTFAPENIN
jgi:hypothetical protein